MVQKRAPFQAKCLKMRWRLGLRPRTPNREQLSVFDARAQVPSALSFVHFKNSIPEWQNRNVLTLVPAPIFLQKKHCIYIQGVPKICIHIKNLILLIKKVKISTSNIYLYWSQFVLKLTSILIQTLLTTRSNGIAHINKHFPWYFAAFMFNCFSQFSDCCRFLSVDFVF